MEEVRQRWTTFCNSVLTYIDIYVTWAAWGINKEALQNTAQDNERKDSKEGSEIRKSSYRHSEIRKPAQDFNKIRESI